MNDKTSWDQHWSCAKTLYSETQMVGFWLFLNALNKNAHSLAFQCRLGVFFYPESDEALECCQRHLISYTRCMSLQCEILHLHVVRLKSYL